MVIVQVKNFGAGSDSPGKLFLAPLLIVEFLAPSTQRLAPSFKLKVEPLAPSFKLRVEHRAPSTKL